MSIFLNKLLSLLAPRHREYVLIDRGGKILETSPGVKRFAEDSDQVRQGQNICLALVIGDREIDRITPQLQCEHTWVIYAIPESMSITQPLIASPTGGLLGQIWTSRSPEWISDITSESLSPILPIAELRSAFGFPIQDDEQILGVITFYSYDVQPPDQELTQVMATIGNQLGQFIKRKQAEAALRQEQEKSEQLLLNILPEPIAERLKHDHQVIAEDF